MKETDKVVKHLNEHVELLDDIDKQVGTIADSIVQEKSDDQKQLVEERKLEYGLLGKIFKKTSIRMERAWQSLRKWQTDTWVKMAQKWNESTVGKAMNVIGGAMVTFKQNLATSFEAANQIIQGKVQEILGDLDQYVKLGFAVVKGVWKTISTLGSSMWKGLFGGVELTYKSAAAKEIDFGMQQEKESSEKKLGAIDSLKEALEGKTNTIIDKMTSVTTTIKEAIKSMIKSDKEAAEKKAKEKIGESPKFKQVMSFFKDTAIITGIVAFFSNITDSIVKKLGMLGKGIMMVLKNPAVLAFLYFGNVLYNAFKGWNDEKTAEIFGEKDSFMSKLGSAISHALSAFTFGLIKPDEIAKGLMEIKKAWTETWTEFSNWASKWANILWSPFQNIIDVVKAGIGWLGDQIILCIPDFIRPWLGLPAKGSKEESERFGKSLEDRLIQAVTNYKEGIMGKKFAPSAAGKPDASADNALTGLKRVFKNTQGQDLIVDANGKVDKSQIELVRNAIKAGNMKTWNIDDDGQLYKKKEERESAPADTLPATSPVEDKKTSAPTPVAKNEAADTPAPPSNMKRVTSAEKEVDDTQKENDEETMKKAINMASNNVKNTSTVMTKNAMGKMNWPSNIDSMPGVFANNVS